MRRLELKVTYQCTSRCDHCLYSSSDRSCMTVSREQLERSIDQANPNEAILFTGGEASIEADLVLYGIAYAKENGIDSWLITNGSWGRDQKFAQTFARNMVSNGLVRVNFSVDSLHQEHIPFTWVSTAMNACKDAGVKTIKAMITFINRGAGISHDERTEELVGLVSQMGGIELDIRPKVTFAGRALTRLKAYAPHLSLAEAVAEQPCDPDILDPSFFIVGPECKVFICAGFAYPGNFLTDEFDTIVCKNKVLEHPLLSAFHSKGIEGLYTFALENGYNTLDYYQSGCHLCYDIRKHLYGRFPECLQPEHAYSE